MGAFTFELDPALRQRRREEESQMRVVAELERERIALEQEIRGCQRAITQEKRDLAERLAAERGGRAVDLGLVRVQANASLHHIGRAQRAVVRLAGVHARIDRARLDLLEKTIARKSLEVLRDERRSAWEQAQRARETAELDEIAAAAASRGAAGGLLDETGGAAA